MGASAIEWLSIYLRVRIIRGAKTCPSQVNKLLPSGENWHPNWLTCPGSNAVAGVVFAPSRETRKMGLFTVRQTESFRRRPMPLARCLEPDDRFGGTTRSAYFLQFSTRPKADEL